LNGLSISQLGAPIIHEVRQDPLVWHLIHSGLADFIAGNTIAALIFDVVIIIPMAVILFFTLSQKLTKRLIFLHCVLFAFYLLIIFSFPSLSIRKYLGLAIVPLIFLFVDNERYKRALSYLRYYVLFIFASSAMWKIVRGAIFESDQFVNILRNQHFEHMVLFPDHISTHIAECLISQETIAFVFYLLIAILQLSFIIGFFTKKYDRWLLIAMLLFVMGDFLVMRVEYWEFLVFVPVFLRKGTKD
jgi:hypothetical protein